MEERKQREAEFHDRMRGVYQQEPDRFSRYLSNRKYYEVTGRSRDFLSNWLVENAKDKEVLDFGCGSGDLSFVALSVARSLQGIDISQESVDLCTQRAEELGFGNKAHFQVMDCENTAFPNASFDVICESGVLHHLDLDKAYAEIQRLLKPGGTAICHEALRHNPLIDLYRRRTPHLRTEWETEHILGEPEIDLARRYFGRVEKHFFHLLGLAAVPFRNTRWGDPIRNVLDRADERVLKVPFVRRQAWICTFTLSEPR